MYRGRRITCPGCRSPMEEIPISLEGGDGAQIDHCTRCGGVFLEFFDGDPVDLSRAAVERLVQHEGAPTTCETATCPDCGTFMPLLSYRELGPVVFRCEACMAVFATQKQLHQLAAFVEPREPARPPSLLAQLKALIVGVDDDEAVD